MSTLIAFVLLILLARHDEWWLAVLLGVGIVARISILLGQLLQVFDDRE